MSSLFKLKMFSLSNDTSFLILLLIYNDTNSRESSLTILPFGLPT